MFSRFIMNVYVCVVCIVFEHNESVCGFENIFVYVVGSINLKISMKIVEIIWKW